MTTIILKSWLSNRPELRRKVNAIKAIKLHTGLPLSRAKQITDELDSVEQSFQLHPSADVTLALRDFKAHFVVTHTAATGEKVTLTGVKVPDQMIPSVKALRSVTHLSLKDAKQIWDYFTDRFNAAAAETIELATTIRSPSGNMMTLDVDHALRILKPYFEFRLAQKVKKVLPLKLWDVYSAQPFGAQYFILAYTEKDAIDSIVNEFVEPQAGANRSIWEAKEVEGPFENGTILRSNAPV